MKISTKLIVFTQLLLLLSFVNAKSQDPIDNAGKDFYFTFMPNWHNFNASSDVLYVFVSGKIPTSGQVEFTNRFGVTSTRNFNINFPGQIRTLTFNPAECELRGQNSSGNLEPTGLDDERVRDISFHLTSNDDVTVVIHNEAQFTSDACLVYPKDALGQNYFVFSYESNFYSSPQNGNQTTPSQFVVVGTEDGTQVTIEPTVRTFRNGLDTQNITLNKGEVYLVQANISFGFNSNESYDLTGTRVKSDKPVAVFGGQQRANIPYTEYASRDYLLSQMIPLESWGRDVFIVPFVQPGDIDNQENDITKITVAYDNTEISFAGQPFKTLNKGEAITQPIEKPIFVTGDKPIRACLYKKSTQSSNTPNGSFNSSDPFMVLFPPKDQFLREYNFINVNLPEKYSAHYVNIIIPTVSIPSLVLDGNPLNGNFAPIEGIAYSYANIQVSPGSHNIVADTNFGICVYGYGQTNSYGYVGGLGLEVLDWTPPEYNSASIDCFNSTFSFTEQNRDDTGIDSIVINRIQNLDLSIIDSSRTNFDANLKLVDKYKDGLIDFYAIDSSGSKTKDTIIIDGFTFTLSADIDNSKFIQKTLTDTVNFNSSNCLELTVTNYGITRKDISKLKLKNGTSLIKSNTPNFLDPGESYTFEVCYESSFDSGWNRDTLELENNCFSEEIGFVGFYQRPDVNKPAAESQDKGCGKAKLLAKEVFDSDYGFGDYEKIVYDNLEFQIEKKNESEIILGLSLIDPNVDGVYEVKFTDRGGNDTTIKGIIQGFTTSFVKDDEVEAISFSTQSIGNSKCIAILIENNGLLPLTLDDIFLSERLNFYIPQSQLPLTVQPDSTVPFTVCFYDRIPNDELLEDVLSMTFNCLSKEVNLDGLTKEIVIKADSRCDYDLTFSFGEVPGSLSIDNVYPNPAANLLKMDLSVDKERQMRIDLIDIDGTRYRMLDSKISSGQYTFRLDINDLPSGNYVLQINSEEKRLTKKVLISQ